MEKTGVCVSTRTIACCARPTATTRCAEHFALGVNFIESLVNRHRIELYILDAQGRIAASFERIHWDEADVVARAMKILDERAAR